MKPRYRVRRTQYGKQHWVVYDTRGTSEIVAAHWTEEEAEQRRRIFEQESGSEVIEADLARWRRRRRGASR